VYKFTCSAPQNRVPPFVETSRRPVTTHCLRLADEDAEQREDRLGQKRVAGASQRADEDVVDVQQHFLLLAKHFPASPVQARLGMMRAVAASRRADQDDEHRQDRLAKKRAAEAEPPPRFVHVRNSGAFFSSARKTVVVCLLF